MEENIERGDHSLKEVDLVTTKEEDKLMRRYAVLSQVAYDIYDTDVETAFERMQEYLPKHKILPELSDKSSGVILKPHKNRPDDVVISYRGTRNVSDALADITQVAPGAPLEKLVGMPSGVFKLAADKYNDVRSKYPDARIITTGHSLGGSLAYYIGKENNVKSYVFNAGSSPADAVTEVNLNHTVDNISTHYYVIGDVVGASKALLGSKRDRLVAIHPTKWITDFLATATAVRVGGLVAGIPGALAGGVAGAFYTWTADLHSLNNFMPPELFKENLEPDDDLYKWVKPMYDMAEARSLLTRRPIMRQFDEPTTIHRDKFLKMCLNPYAQDCKRLIDRPPTDVN